MSDLVSCAGGHGCDRLDSMSSVLAGGKDADPRSAVRFGVWTQTPCCREKKQILPLLRTKYGHRPDFWLLPVVLI